MWFPQAQIIVEEKTTTLNKTNPEGKEKKRATEPVTVLQTLRLTANTN